MTTESNDPSLGAAPHPSSSSAKRMHPPEVQAGIDEFNRKLGAALVANLNRNVMAEAEPSSGAAPAVAPARNSTNGDPAEGAEAASASPEG